MTKEIKKKRSIDWIVFWIWALTAVILLTNAYGIYHFYAYDPHAKVVNVSYGSYLSDSYTHLVDQTWQRRETTEQRSDSESTKTTGQQQRVNIRVHYPEQQNALLRTILVAVYVLISTIVFFGVRGRSNVLTVVFVFLIVLNVVLVIKSPMHYPLLAHLISH